MRFHVDPILRYVLLVRYGLDGLVNVIGQLLGYQWPVAVGIILDVQFSGQEVSCERNTYILLLNAYIGISLLKDARIFSLYIFIIFLRVNHMYIHHVFVQ